MGINLSREGPVHNFYPSTGINDILLRPKDENEIFIDDEFDSDEIEYIQDNLVIDEYDDLSDDDMDRTDDMDTTPSQCESEEEYRIRWSSKRNSLGPEKDNVRKKSGNGGGNRLGLFIPTVTISIILTCLFIYTVRKKR